MLVFLVQLGAEAQASEVRTRERTGDSLKRLGGHNCRCTQRRSGPAREARCHLGGQEERGRTIIRASFPTSAPKHDTAYRSSGGRRESPLPLQDPEAGPGQPHCCETHEQAPSAASAVLGVCEPQLPIRGLQGGAKCHACCPEGVQGPPHLHTPDEGNNSQHTLRKEAVSTKLKAAP